MQEESRLGMSTQAGSSSADHGGVSWVETPTGDRLQIMGIIIKQAGIMEKASERCQDKKETGSMVCGSHAIMEEIIMHRLAETNGKDKKKTGQPEGIGMTV